MTQTRRMKSGFVGAERRERRQRVSRSAWQTGVQGLGAVLAHPPGFARAPEDWSTRTLARAAGLGGRSKARTDEAEECPRSPLALLAGKQPLGGALQKGDDVAVGIE